ncbi:uncharacterized protein LOC112345073 [Selaginella moellendorffii]|uniref:uncharacterized protein LOC112345073 n=1 Tax=Selaginella moellendorffii TaxID=88036 RepID=UPI000D1C4F27|nr:uncharacterized protein LOC112345073 [Selaginella moellendorffii]|eukprot:XP_024526772.1 uncharacterized protein LOC112345073 [Selaginella moellendorffii]
MDLLDAVDREAGEPGARELEAAQRRLVHVEAVLLLGLPHELEVEKGGGGEAGSFQAEEMEGLEIFQHRAQAHELLQLGIVHEHVLEDAPSQAREDDGATILILDLKLGALAAANSTHLVHELEAAELVAAREPADERAAKVESAPEVEHLEGVAEIGGPGVQELLAAGAAAHEAIDEELPEARAALQHPRVNLEHLARGSPPPPGAIAAVVIAAATAAAAADLAARFAIQARAASTSVVEIAEEVEAEDVNARGGVAPPAAHGRRLGNAPRLDELGENGGDDAVRDHVDAAAAAAGAAAEFLLALRHSCELPQH